MLEILLGDDLVFVFIIGLEIIFMIDKVSSFLLGFECKNYEVYRLVVGGEWGGYCWELVSFKIGSGEFKIFMYGIV